MWHRRKSHLRKCYGLAITDYMDMAERQNNACAVCGRVPTRELLMVDHDHITGKIRGLLCRPCNMGIGFLGDNLDGVKKAINYLARSEEL